MIFIGQIFMMIGAFFYAIGGLGLFRMPDLYNRIQAGTKATTLGTLSMVIGAAVINPSWIPKLLIILIFIMITNPVGSSVLARAAYLKKYQYYNKTKDKIESDLLDEGGQK